MIGSVADLSRAVLMFTTLATVIAVVVVALPMAWEIADLASGYTLRPRWFRRLTCWFAKHDAGHPPDGPNNRCLRCGGRLPS